VPRSKNDWSYTSRDVVLVLFIVWTKDKQLFTVNTGLLRNVTQGLGIGGEGCCEDSNEPAGSIKGGEFLD
jgi:hypothetical protein